MIQSGLSPKVSEVYAAQSSTARPQTRTQAVFNCLWRHPWITSLVLLFLAICIPFLIIYVKYYRIVTSSLETGLFAKASNIFTAPRLLVPGEEISPEVIAGGLERAGYSASQGNTTGWYRTNADSIEVHPGEKSYFQEHPALIRFN